MKANIDETVLMAFKRDISIVINRYGFDTLTAIPDYILAEYLADNLANS